jgi:hypothetical protein
MEACFRDTKALEGFLQHDIIAIPCDLVVATHCDPITATSHDIFVATPHNVATSSRWKRKIHVVATPPDATTLHNASTTLMLQHVATPGEH